jgi:dTDP-4-dehydrorhamnose reductase
MHLVMTNERPPLEVWGGLECTVNRVGDRYFDQLDRSGHDRRLSDLDAIAALGIRTLRYPALWERVAPDGPARVDWGPLDEALGRLRELGIDPIIGLVHHGSGPRWTHLLDPGFVSGLAEYAGAFAARYPWIRRYTPVNEPLTTARFAALYGHWYPHRKDDAAFVAALMIQCRATVAAMHAIRTSVPDAELIQTEDAGSTRGTAATAGQVAFEMDRRWLSLDLLTGRVQRDHPMWRYLRESGATEEELTWFEQHPEPPALIGLNYYVTSDRYLDERLDRYPASTHGGNALRRYADVDAARVAGVGLRGHAVVLDEAWARYGRPVAITEAHLGCTREEQLRWLAEAWQGAQAARSAGADVRAVTAWALLGSWDWNSLVTRPGTHYEAGAFDVRGGRPRATALAGLITDLAAGRPAAHPLLAGAGWWRRPAAKPAVPMRPLLILGAAGTLGRAFVDACNTRGIAFLAFSRGDIDIADMAAVNAAVRRWSPWAIVNAAGYVRVDEAERERAACRRANAVGPAVLAAACRRAGISLMTFSSDLVFGGDSQRPYVESDAVEALNIYGRTKIEAERRVLALDPAALVIRTSAFFGPRDVHNFVSAALGALASGSPFRAASDVVVSPTYVPDLADASLDLLIDGASGVWHLANAGAVSWAEFASRAAAAAGLSVDGVEPCALQHLNLPALRPRYSVLGTERGFSLPPLDESLARYVVERQRLGAAA